jgi:hypothetical protein
MSRTVLFVQAFVVSASMAMTAMRAARKMKTLVVVVAAAAVMEKEASETLRERLILTENHLEDWFVVLAAKAPAAVPAEQEALLPEI